MFSPAGCSPQLAGSLSPCSATVSLTATGSAVDGSTVVTISASPLGLTTKPATFTLTVFGAFDYSLSALPSTLSVTQGGVAGVETVTAVLTSGQAQSVTFSISGLPSGVTASLFSPASCSPQLAGSLSPFFFNDTATTEIYALSLHDALPISASPLGLTTKPATFTLTVFGAFDYSLSALPSTLSVTQGGVAGVVTSIALLTSGQALSVTFSISGLPSGVTASLFSPASCSPQLAGSLSPFFFNDTATTEIYALSLHDALPISASPLGLTTKPATFTLTVVGAFDYSLSALPSTLSVTQAGVDAAETVTAVLTSGQPQSVTFSISGLPSGVTASLFSPASCSPQLAGSLSPCSAFFFNDTATTEIYTLSLHDALPISLGLTTKPATFTLTVVGAFDYSLSALPSTLSVT